MIKKLLLKQVWLKFGKISNLFQKLVTKNGFLLNHFIKNGKKDKLKIYKSNVYSSSLKHFPEYLKTGFEVLTPEGIGKIKHRTGDLVTVYLFKKYFKTFNSKAIYSYFTFVPDTKQEIILTPSHNLFIIKDGQEIEYTISSKGKAKLTKKYMERFKYLEIFNEYKYGRFFYNKLQENDFIIIKRRNNE